MTSADSAAQPDRWRSWDAWIVLLLVLVSTYNFVRRGPTAFEWPGVDMATFFERQEDPDFLANDYFTNAISQPNPRHVFGHCVLAIARVFGTDWYAVYFAIRVTLTLLLPVLWYLALIGSMGPRLADDRQRAVARGALAVAMIAGMRSDVARWFTIAWWQPFTVYTGAYPVAVCLGLVAIVLHSRLPDKTRPLAGLMFAASVLVHPPIGMFMFGYFLVVSLGYVPFKQLAALGLGCVLLPAAAMSWWYRPETPLSASQFIEIYIHSRHPFHYHVGSFASQTKFPWWVHFGLLLGLMLAAGGVGWWRGSRALVRSALLAAGAYAGCVVLQYLGTDFWPNKTIAAVGPSRFSFLGYFLMLFVGVQALAMTWPARWQVPAGLRQFAARWLAGCRPAYVAFGTAATCVLLVVCCRDDLQGDIRGEHVAFYDWVAQHTSPDDVFHTAFNQPLHQRLPVIAERSVLAAAGFPFREDSFQEHHARLALAYGTRQQLAGHTGENQSARRTAYYRTLTPKDMVRIADERRLDYVIVERKFQRAYAAHAPCYEDASIAVYAIGDLRRTLDATAQGPAKDPAESRLRETNQTGTVPPPTMVR